MKFLVVVRGPKEVFDYSQYLENSVHIRYLKLVEESQKKEAADNGYILSVLRFIIMLRLSRYNFSFYHAVFIRKHDFLITFITRLLNRLKVNDNHLHKVEKFLIAILRLRHPFLSYRMRKRLEEFEGVLFTSTFETLTEILLIDYARRAELLVTYHPYNWDNPTSKTTIPFGRLQRIYAWGDQMKRDLENLYPNVEILVAPPPRIANEIRNSGNIQNQRQAFKSPDGLIRIAIFESQKNDDLASLTANLSQIPSRIRLRPHPFSTRKISDYKNLNVELDPYFEAEASPAITPAEMQKAEEKFMEDKREWIWEDCDIVVSAGGTSMLEAALRGIAVIIDNRNYKNVTVAYTPYKTHLRSFLRETFVEQVFFDDDIISAVTRLRRRNLSRTIIKEQAGKYCDVYQKFNLQVTK